MLAKLINIIKTGWKKTLIIREVFFVILFILCCVWVYRIFHQPKKVKPGNLKPVMTWVDGNTKHSVVTADKIDKATIEGQAHPLKDKNAKPKEVIVYVYKIDTVFVDLPVYTDTSGNFLVEKIDSPHLIIRATGNTRTKKGSIKQSITDTTSIVGYEHPRLLRNSEYKFDIKHSNPYITDTLASASVIKPARTLFNVGLQVGYNPFNNKPYVGIGVNIPIFSIKIPGK